MFEAIKRWMSAEPPGPDWAGVAAWAKEHQYGFKRAKDNEGFVIDGTFGDSPWRLEWGPPQRSYITTQELRIRMELHLPSDLQMLLLSRPLMEMLEGETFDRYTQSTQTQIDLSTPEEMRWLAMFPKSTLMLPKGVRTHFGTVASNPKAAIAWVDTVVAAQLELAAQSWLRDAPPFLLMTLRGRLYLRLQLDPPEPSAVAGAVALFDVAAQSAMRVAGMGHEGAAEWPSSGASTAWQTQLEDPGEPGR